MPRANATGITGRKTSPADDKAATCLGNGIDVGFVDKGRAAPLAGFSKSARELVDIAGRIRRRVEAAKIVLAQRRLDGADLLWRYRAAIEPAFLQQRIDLQAGFKTLLVVIDVQDAAAFEIEVDAFALRDLEQMLASFDREPRGLNRVGAVVADIGDELAHPRIFVPVRPRVHQQRRIAPEHPAQAFQDRCGAVPHFGIAGGELSAIGEGGLHRGVAVLVEHRHLVSAFEQGIGSRYAGDAGADDGDMGHGRFGAPVS
ncbi:hypothetical protein ACVWZR_007449 [Bradyrhizobium sp. i1.3.1]